MYAWQALGTREREERGERNKGGLSADISYARWREGGGLVRRGAMTEIHDRHTAQHAHAYTCVFKKAVRVCVFVCVEQHAAGSAHIDVDMISLLGK